jgi:hypothetical protein
MKAERLLPSGRRVLFLAVGDADGGVEVDSQLTAWLRCRPCRPCAGAGHSSVDPACDTTPFPSALTLTLLRLPLRFTSGVPSCPGLSIIQQFDFPVQARHFFVSQARVGLPV